jgi:putative endonuclease
LPRRTSRVRASSPAPAFAWSVAKSEGWSVRRSLGEGGPRSDPSYGWPASQITPAPPRNSRMKMHHAYLLRSKSHPKERYVGSTTDLKQRILDHNHGHSPHTAKFHSVGARGLLCSQRERKSCGIREISKIRFGQGVRDTPLLLIDQGFLF